MAASKLDDECGRLCCNLLDAALACSNLAPWCPSWGRSPWLATTTTPFSSLPCHCQPLALLLPLHHVPLSCMHAVVALKPGQWLLLRSPQLVLLLLALIASLIPAWPFCLFAANNIKGESDGGWWWRRIKWINESVMCLMVTS
jgi:hypothetical protein